MVPTARLELAQLSPLPPQDSVSTNFTTSAFRKFASSTRDKTEPDESKHCKLRPQTTDKTLLRYIFRLRTIHRLAGCRNLRRSLSRCALARSRSRRFYNVLHHAAKCFWLLRSKICQSQAGDKENTSQDRGGTRQEVGRPGCTEQTARSAATEGGTHVRPLAVLQQHQPDNDHRREQMHHQGDRKQEIHEIPQ